MINNKKVAIVTGGAGFIGSHMVDLLISKNYQVRIVDNLSGGHKKNLKHCLKNRNLHFKSDVIELSGQIEFNFLPYETGNSLYPFTPFIFTGVSLFNYNPKAEASDGQWYALQEIGTEGQGTTSFPNRKKYALTQMSIPFGGGVKIGVADDFNIIIEYGLRKTFTDYIDDVSSTYAGIPAEFDNITIGDEILQQAGLSDPSKMS